jgi:hypothetical protein
MADWNEPELVGVAELYTGLDTGVFRKAVELTVAGDAVDDEPLTFGLPLVDVCEELPVALASVVALGVAEPDLPELDFPDEVLEGLGATGSATGEGCGFTAGDTDGAGVAVLLVPGEADDDGLLEGLLDGVPVEESLGELDGLGLAEELTAGVLSVASSHAPGMPSPITTSLHTPETATPPEQPSGVVDTNNPLFGGWTVSGMGEGDPGSVQSVMEPITGRVMVPDGLVPLVS